MSEICRSLASYYWKSGVQEKPGSNLSPRFLFGMRNLRHVTLSDIYSTGHTKIRLHEVQSRLYQGGDRSVVVLV